MTKDYWRFMDKCPYCERPFKDKNPSINQKVIRQMVDNYLNSNQEQI